MVFVESYEELFIEDAKGKLFQRLNSLVGRKNVDEAFCFWLLENTEIPFQIHNMISEALKHIGGQLTYRDVAILGYAAAARVLKDVDLDFLKNSLMWISGREPFIGKELQLQGFCTDVISLLGIALGAKTLDDVKVNLKIRDWFAKFIDQSFRCRLSEWEKSILVAVCQTIGIQAQVDFIYQPTLADVRISLKEKGALNYDADLERKDRYSVLLLIKQGSANDLSDAQVATRLAALFSNQRITPIVNLNGATVDDVSRILKRIPDAFRLWTWEERPRTKGGTARKWDIDNEYHVQNLLYFLLSPYFPELIEEENLPSVGQKKPRADLLIPNLSLIIEVKFMRKKTTPQDMIEQISADSGLYLTQESSYDKIIVFIWDDSNQSQEHDYMCKGLRRISGIVDAIVMSRPGKLMNYRTSQSNSV